MAARSPLLLVVLLVVPGATALPLQGELWFAEAPALQGDATFSAPDGILDLSGRVMENAPLRVSWASAFGAMLVYRGQQIATNDVDDGPDDQTLAWGPGSLDGLACAGLRCRVALQAGDGGAVGLQGPASGTPLVATGPARIDVGVEGGKLYLGLDLAPRRLEETPGQGALGNAPRTPFASGNVTLYMWDAEGVVHLANGSDAVWTGQREEPLDPRVPTLAGRKYELRLLALTLVDPRVEAEPSTQDALFAPAMRATLSGGLASARADGWAQSGATRVDVRGQPVEASGELSVSLAVAPPADGPAAQPADALAERQRGDLAGDGLLIVGGSVVGQARAAPAPAVAAVGTGLVALLVIVALRMGAFAALYTRITSGRVLENATRVALYDLIRRRPGIHVSELAREVGLGRVTIQHHLRMLEAHHIVTSRARGRELTYFVPGFVPGEEELSARMALKDETRRRILETVAQGHGATQADIAAATSISPRLVSYHVTRLEAAGLVQGDASRPKRYQARTR